MQMDEEVGKLASATPVMICMLLSYLLATYNLFVLSPLLVMRMVGVASKMGLGPGIEKQG